MSKYRYELQEPIKQTLLDTLKGSQPNPNVTDGHLLVIDNENVIDALNRLLATIDGSLTPIGRLQGTVTTYEVAPSSYRALLNHLK